jgi:hypothetical protein
MNKYDNKERSRTYYPLTYTDFTIGTHINNAKQRPKLRAPNLTPS